MGPGLPEMTATGADASPRGGRRVSAWPAYQPKPTVPADLVCPPFPSSCASRSLDVVEIHPVRIPGRWADGRALDVHTASSTAALYEGGDARMVYALTLTRTRSNQ
jgi:hypothetical protein